MGTPIEGEVSPYEPAKRLGSQVDFSYLPAEDQKRAQAYKKYDQLYWNDREQYTLRVLEGEEPVHVPNPRTVVDTTAHFFMKGLRISPKDPENSAPAPRNLNAEAEVQSEDEDESRKPGDDEGEAVGKPQEARAKLSMGDALKAFLDREMFYARFQNAKHAGVARGDFAFHMTADPEAEEGSRISLTPVQPWKIILDEDPEDSTKIIEVHLVDLVVHPADKDKKVVRELRYWYDEAKLVHSQQILWSTETAWYDEEERQAVETGEEFVFDSAIKSIPVYVFHNTNWDSARYGTSELRGFETTFQGISQITTDQSAALALEGLGVYVTDGGPPVNATTGKPEDWVISPGRVVEPPGGSYFRRVEGVGSVKPNMDHIEYMESKIREAGGLSDVALGRVDVQTAQSGIALAIKFMPTLAKLEERDEAGVGKLKQLFYDWKAWHGVYENQVFDEEIVVTLGDKLPSNRTDRVNELNNMLDRGVISRKYYRAEMQNLGYIFPDDIEEQIDQEDAKEAEKAAARAPEGLQDNAEDAAKGIKDPPPNPNQPGVKTKKSERPNRSNNSGKPNESSGTEATQSVANQARGGKSLAHAS